MTVTREQAVEAMRRAYQAGDMEAAKRAAEIAEKLRPTQEPKSLGKRILEQFTGDDDPTTQNLGEKIGTAINMAGEAMTGGLIGDEASGVAAGALAAIIPGGETYQQAYERRRDMERQQQQILETTNPGLAFGAQVGGAVLPAALGIGTGALTLGRAVGVGAGTGATYAAMEAEGGAANRVRAGVAGLVLGGVAGAAAIPVGKVAAWASRKFGKAAGAVFRNQQYFRNGQLTPTGRETLEALGYKVDELSEAFKREFQRNVDDAIEPSQAARVAGLREFGIPAFRANATGSVDDFAALEGARRGGAYSPATQERVRSALTEQEGAMRRAADDIATGLGGGVRGDQYDAAISTMSGLRSARDAARAAAREAYDELEMSGAGISGQAVQNFGATLRNAMRVAGETVDDAASPNAAAAFRYLDEAFTAGEKGSVPFMTIERARQRLVQMRAAAYRGSNGADQIAMAKLVDAFDGKIDDLMMRAMTEGDAATLEAAKRARGLWREYSTRFTGDGAASRFIQDLVDADASPDDAVKWLFSSGKLGTGKFNSTLARGLKETLGEDSEQWKMIRQAAFRQLTEKPEGTTQLGPQALRTRINDFIHSPATRALSRELYSEEELNLMRRYASALGNLVPPPGSVNYSGSGYEVARNVRTALRGFGIIGGGAVAGPLGGGAGALAAEGAQRGSDWLAGRAILEVAPRNVPRVAARAGGVVGGGVGVAAEEQLRPYLPGFAPQ